MERRKVLQDRLGGQRRGAAMCGRQQVRPRAGPWCMRRGPAGTVAGSPPRSTAGVARGLITGSFPGGDIRHAAIHVP